MALDCAFNRKLLFLYEADAYQDGWREFGVSLHDEDRRWGFLFGGRSREGSLAEADLEGVRLLRGRGVNLLYYEQSLSRSCANAARRRC